MTVARKDLIAVGSRVRVRDDGPAVWADQAGVVKVAYERSAHVLMDTSKTLVMFFMGELEVVVPIGGWSS